MISTWANTKLADVLRTTTREEPVDRSATYRLLGVRLDGGGPFLREEKSGTAISAEKLASVRAGNFIYSRLFAWRGAFGVIPPELDGCHVSGEFPTFAAVPESLNLNFLRYWFRLPGTLRTVEAWCSGSTPLTRNRLKEERFLALEVPLPPLAEQRRIVARIEELALRLAGAGEMRLEANREAHVASRNTIGSVYTTLQGAHGLSALAPFRPHVTSGPRNWAARYEPRGMRFYRAQDVGPDGETIDDARVYISPPSGLQGQGAQVMPGDLLFVITGATVGRCAMITSAHEPGYVSQHVALCRLPQDQLDPRFVSWMLRGPQGQHQLLGQRYGQGKPGLNLANIRALKLPAPTLPEQYRAIAYLDALQASFREVATLQRETAGELGALLPSILDKAFRGGL